MLACVHIKIAEEIVYLSAVKADIGKATYLVFRNVCFCHGEKVFEDGSSGHGVQLFILQL